jgi:outer membrane protein assembly factor BamE (lipoprotein component of BamABCDE complex)
MVSSNSKRLLAIALASGAFASPVAIQPAQAAASTRIDVYASASYARKDEAFRRITAGMNAQQVASLIGAPDRKMRLEGTRTTSWDYSFRDTWGYDAEFSVIFGDDGIVSSTDTTRLDD